MDNSVTVEELIAYLSEQPLEAIVKFDCESEGVYMYVKQGFTSADGSIVYLQEA